MKSRAAVIRSSPGKYELVEVELDAPRRGELQVKMVATGLCHSDEHLQTGDLTAGHYPIVGGHEGAGIVEAVGPDTPGWDIGDHVVFAFIPSCGRCRWCSEGATNLCDLGAHLMRGSRFDDLESFRLHLPDGTNVGQTCGVGTFADRTLVSVDSAIKVPRDLPLETLCLLGCGVGTGWGSAVYAAQTKPGDVVIVAGIGGVGINAVQGASHAGAVDVIAVDPVDSKLEVAARLGATRTYGSIAEAQSYASSITNGQGADAAILTMGVVSGADIAEGFSAIRKGGTVVVTGVSQSSEVGIPISPTELTLMQKSIQGALFGQCNPRSDIPRQIRMYREGQLKLDELVTTTYCLDDVGQAFEDMLTGKNIRGVITFN